MIELRLFYDGDSWIAENHSMSARGKTLPELDQAVASALREKKKDEHADQGPLKVRMYFDNSTIPQWMRQYSGHYFNRVVMINL